MEQLSLKQRDVNSFCSSPNSSEALYLLRSLDSNEIRKQVPSFMQTQEQQQLLQNQRQSGHSISIGSYKLHDCCGSHNRKLTGSDNNTNNANVITPKNQDLNYNSRSLTRPKSNERSASSKYNTRNSQNRLSAKAQCQKENNFEQFTSMGMKTTNESNPMNSLTQTKTIKLSLDLNSNSNGQNSRSNANINRAGGLQTNTQKTTTELLQNQGLINVNSGACTTTQQSRNPNFAKSISQQYSQITPNKKFKPTNLLIHQHHNQNSHSISLFQQNSNNISQVQQPTLQKDQNRKSCVILKNYQIIEENTQPQNSHQNTSEIFDLKDYLQSKKTSAHQSIHEFGSISSAIQNIQPNQLTTIESNYQQQRTIPNLQTLGSQSANTNKNKSMNNRTSDYQNQNKSGKKSMKLKITGFTVQNDYKSPVREIIGAQNISSNKSNVKINKVERDHRKSTEKLHNTLQQQKQQQNVYSQKNINVEQFGLQNFQQQPNHNSQFYTVKNHEKFEKFKKKWVKEENYTSFKINETRKHSNSKSPERIPKPDQQFQNQEKPKDNQSKVQIKESPKRVIEHFQINDDHSPIDFNRNNFDKRDKSISKINTPINPTRNSRISTPVLNKSQIKISINNRSANSLLLLDDYSPSILGKKSLRNHSTFDIVTTASDPDFNCQMKQQMREFMTPSEIKNLNYPTQNCYDFLKKSLQSQKQLSNEFIKASDTLKSLSQSILFFMSFYKDMETMINDNKSMTLQQDLIQLMKRYALNQLDFDIEDMNSRNCDYQRIQQNQQASIDDITVFLRYARSQRVEIEKKQYENLQNELKTYKEQNQKMQQQLKIKNRNENFTQCTVNHIKNQNQKGIRNQGLGYPFNSGSKGLGQMNRIIMELQAQIEKRSKCIEDLDNKIKIQSQDHEKYKEEVAQKQKQMKNVIQEMTNKFKKLKEEKDQLKTIMMASENIDPEEHKQILLERNRGLERISLLESINQQLVEVINQEDKFKQMKKIFIDLSNILVSKKDSKIEMSYTQQEFFKFIINESLKIEVESTVKGKKIMQNLSDELIQNMQNVINWLSQYYDSGLHDVKLQNQIQLIQNQQNFSIQKFIDIFGERPQYNGELLSARKYQSNIRSIERVRDTNNYEDNEFSEIESTTPIKFQQQQQSDIKQKYSITRKIELTKQSFNGRQINHASTPLALTSIQLTNQSDSHSDIQNLFYNQQSSRLQNYQDNNFLQPQLIPPQSYIVKVDLSPCSNNLIDDNSSNGFYRKTPVQVGVNQSNSNNNGAKKNSKKQLKQQLILMRKENRELRKLIENIQVEQGNNSRLRSITPNSIRNHESARVGNFQPLCSQRYLDQDFQEIQTEQEGFKNQTGIDNKNKADFNQIDLLKSLHSMAYLLEESIQPELSKKPKKSIQQKPQFEEQIN